MPYGFGRQLPIVPPSLNDLNLPPTPFNFLATMAVENHTEDSNDANYSPQSPEPSKPSPILTPPKNISNFDSWETSYTTTDDNAFYSSAEPRRIYFLPPSPSSPPSPPRKMNWKLARWKSNPKREAVLQHVCEACGQTSKGHSRSISKELTPLGHWNSFMKLLNLWFHLLKHSTHHVFINFIFRIRTRYVSTLYSHM